jgi:hypothetical protein
MKWIISSNRRSTAIIHRRYSTPSTQFVRKEICLELHPMAVGKKYESHSELKGQISVIQPTGS